MRACFGILLAVLSANAQPNFTIPGLRILTNREVLLPVTGAIGSNITIRASTNLPQFNPLLTFRSTGVNNHIDTAGPYLNWRFYYPQYAPSDALTGDYLATTNGSLIIHPMEHATFLVSWNGVSIYNDPTNRTALLNELPRADLILVSHSHSDHFNSTSIEMLRTANTVIVCPQAVYSGLTVNQRTQAVVLANNTSTNVLGIRVDAVPAYNPTYHPVGTGNGYVLTIGGRRIYASGDTGPAVELRTLPNIDVAFVCMNLPFTMDITNAASIVRDMRPKVVFPYHFRNSDGTFANLELFKRLVGTDRGIEVRARKWY